MSRTIGSATTFTPAAPGSVARAARRLTTLGGRREARGGSRNDFPVLLEEYRLSLDPWIDPVEVCLRTPYCPCPDCDWDRAYEAYLAESRTEDEMNADWAEARGEDPHVYLDHGYAKYLERRWFAGEREEWERSFEIEWAYGLLDEDLGVASSNGEDSETCINPDCECHWRALERLRMKEAIEEASVVVVADLGTETFLQLSRLPQFAAIAGLLPQPEARFPSSDSSVEPRNASVSPSPVIS